MRKGEISIILPRDLYLLKGNSNAFGPYGSCSPQGQIEYNLFYRNFIYPFEENFDVICTCEYGHMFTDFWRFNGVCDKESFPLELQVYSAYGELLAQTRVTVHMTEDTGREFGLLCIGDSMTRSGVYVHQAADLLPSLKTMGTKCFDGVHFAEGRGGWHTMHYFERVDGEGTFSPFLFPKTVAGEKYLGNVVNWKRAALESPEDYDCVGLQKVAEFYGLNEFDEEGFPTVAKEGDVVNRGGLFCRENGSWVPFEDEYEFNFSKYVERYGAFMQETAGAKRPDAVSILLGTNDFYFVPYGEIYQKIEEVIGRYKVMIESIKACDPEIRIILNFPVQVAGAGYPQARLEGSTAKKCRFNILSFCEKLAEVWDNEEARAVGIYLSPMMNFQDMVNGFSSDQISIGSHFEGTMPVHTNAVHPSTNGYKQMGDVLAGVVAEVMKR